MWTGGVNLFLSPHNDDETLFGSYTLLRHRPHVVIVLRSFVEETWVPPVDYRVRECETMLAMQVLGCTWEQWTFEDELPDWSEVRRRLTTYTPQCVWAPAWEEGGHAHHNALATLAADLWPERTTHYLTYTHARGKSEYGTQVHAEKNWPALKARAMKAYASQHRPETGMHFTRGLEEYYL